MYVKYFDLADCSVLVSAILLTQQHHNGLFSCHAATDFNVKYLADCVIPKTAFLRMFSRSAQFRLRHQETSQDDALSSWFPVSGMVDARKPVCSPVCNVQQQREVDISELDIRSSQTDSAKPNPRIRECTASIWQAQRSTENVVGKLATRPSVIVYTPQKTALRLVTHLQHDHVVLVHHSVRPLKDSIAVHLDLLRELVRRITRQDLPAHHLCPPLKPRPPLFRHHVPRCPAELLRRVASRCTHLCRRTCPSIRGALPWLVRPGQ